MWRELFACGHALGMTDRFALKGTEPQYAPDRPFDADHIRLDLRLNLSTRTLTGECLTRLTALADGADRVVFDAVNMTIVSVRAGGAAVRFEYDKKRLTVHLARPVAAGRRVDVAVAYRVRQPALGLHFVGPDRAYPAKPVQAWTQGEDEFARYWFPCHDAPHDRVTSEVLVRMPRGFTAVSNGRLVKRVAGRRDTLFHWAHNIPHATYLVSLAVGQFTEIRDRWRKVPVLYYVPPGREADARRAFGKTPRMMEFFSDRTGEPYPYAKYAQVAAVDFIFGGMENTSATTQTALTLHDERAHLDFSSDPLVAHELAHQWFGDLLTCRDWSHAWLNESFATYFEALFTEFDKGADEFAVELFHNADIYFEEDKDHYRRPLVTKMFKRPSDLFDRHLYEKGSLVLHMMRAELGDADFWRVIRAYVRDNRGKTVDTGRLLDAVESATGKNLSRFFDQWVYGAGHPELKVRHWWDPRRREAVVRVTQTHTTNAQCGLFHLPVEFLFRVNGENVFCRDTVHKQSHLFRFRLKAAPDMVLFDPHHALLKKVDFAKSESLWINQLRDDPHVIGRAQAADALGQRATRSAVTALAEAVDKEPFWHVQGAVAKALARAGTAEAVGALLKAHDRWTHPKARRALVAAMGDCGDPALHDRLREHQGREAGYFAHAQSLRALARRGDWTVRRWIDAALHSDSWNDVIACGAVEALARLKPDDHVPVLLRETAYGRPHTRRMTAIRCLAQVGGGRDDVQRRLLALLKDPYLLVQLSAVSALSRLGDERAIPALKVLTTGDRDGRLLRAAEEAVARLSKGIDEKNGRDKTS